MKIIEFRKLALVSMAVVAFSTVSAQKTATVSGRYEYHLGNDDNVTIREAKNKAIEMAKSEAIAKEFGMLVASDYINMESAVNDEFSQFYMMDTSTSAKGEWLGDLEDPKVEMKIDSNGDLWFIAEVKGKAREINRAKTSLTWNIQKEEDGRKVTTTSFNSGERFFVNFKSPADGYLAIYLISGDDETSCLLPYRHDTSGRFKVKGGVEYTFFDKSTDPTASLYKFTTDKPMESNQLVVVFSPNPFTKCTDVSMDPKRPNVLKSKDFASWLLKAQRADNELVVNKKWAQITGDK